ncbi:hypothetical protein Megvenef_01135 [Candidatus Megaera venefica]|uniref:Uncharacterized protein n=1 Tax=Candidatus Megaera venefica TaxID=2055910 RepID=A0ABU5NDA7_9RICK|nr:hypothetical protein [Candidatus Megaera venefica]
MCGDLFLKFLKLYQKFRVLTERLIMLMEKKSIIHSSGWFQMVLMKPSGKALNFNWHYNKAIFGTQIRFN